MGFETILVDFDGSVIARASVPRPPRASAPVGDTRPLIERLAAAPFGADDDDEMLEES